MQAWPKPRKKKASPLQLEQQQRFQNANYIAKFADGQILEAANKLGEKGPLYPRDYIVSAMFGGLFIFHLPDGRRVYPMSLVQDMTKDLDIIAQMPGMIMGRDSKVWAPIAPTADGQVLYWPDKDALPVPVAPGPEIGGHMITSLPLGVANTQAHAAHGNIFTCNKKTTVVACWGLHLGIVSATYKYVCFRIEGTTTKEVIAESIEFTRTVSNSRRDRHPFTTTCVLEAATKYAILLIRTDSTTTAQNNLWAATRVGYGGYPNGHDMQFANYNLNASTLEVAAAQVGSTAFFALDLEMKL